MGAKSEATPVANGESPRRPSPLRRCYDWVLRWADTPYGIPALFVLAFAESSFFPIPPDVLLMALTLGRPARAFLFAAVCSIGSVLGGILGYFIGRFVWQAVQGFFFTYVFSREAFETVTRAYGEQAFWATFTAGFTPIPYKVFTIAGGVASVPFVGFVIASALSRSLRFFVVAGLIHFFGPAVKTKIERHFDVLSLVFMALLIGGFLLVKYLLH